MTVQEIAVLLDHRFQLLTTGPRTVADRQRTLSALVQWSYDLLDENEQQALCQFSVFAGGWDLVGAGRVIEVGNSDPPSLLASLVDKQLHGTRDEQ